MTTTKPSPSSLVPNWTQASTESELRQIFDTQQSKSSSTIMFLLIHSSMPQMTDNNNNNALKKEETLSKIKSITEKNLEAHFLSNEKLCTKVATATSNSKKSKNTNSNNNNNNTSSSISLKLVEWKIDLMERGSFSKTLAAAMNVPLLGITLGAVFNGELLDILKIDEGNNNTNTTNTNNNNIDEEKLATFSSKFAQFCLHKLFSSSNPVQVAAKKTDDEGNTGASVDVAKLLSMGKDLLAKRTPLYAEKFFSRAIDTLEAVVTDPAMKLKIQDSQDYFNNINKLNSNNDGNDSSSTSTSTTSSSLQKVTDADLDNVSDIIASLADALAWRALSRFILGETKNGKLAADVERMNEVLKLSKYAEDAARAPLGVVLRAETLNSMNDALANLSAEAKWDEKACSEKKLREKLLVQPNNTEKDHHHHQEVARALLVFTLFLSGDMERCLTEVIKLKSYGSSFGTSALSAITRFLGPEHELVKRL